MKKRSAFFDWFVEQFGKRPSRKDTTKSEKKLREEAREWEIKYDAALKGWCAGGNREKGS